MLKKILALILVTAAAQSAQAVDITAIFGSGNPNTGWTVGTGSGITLGLRAKDRDTASTANVNGVYSFATPNSTGNPARLKWNYEFSINAGTALLTSYDFYLQADDDASGSTSLTTVAPLSYWLDNSYGNAGTANGAGVEGTYAALAGSNSIGQNSQNGRFGDYPGGALVSTANATYDFTLYAVAAGAGAGGTRLAFTSMQVVVGAGGGASSVPDAGSTAMLLGMGLTGLVAARRRFVK